MRPVQICRQYRACAIVPLFPTLGSTIVVFRLSPILQGIMELVYHTPSDQTHTLKSLRKLQKIVAKTYKIHNLCIIWPYILTERKLSMKIVFILERYFYQLGTLYLG